MDILCFCSINININIIYAYYGGSSKSNEVEKRSNLARRKYDDKTLVQYLDRTATLFTFCIFNPEFDSCFLFFTAD